MWIHAAGAETNSISQKSTFVGIAGSMMTALGPALTTRVLLVQRESCTNDRG